MKPLIRLAFLILFSFLFTQGFTCTIFYITMNGIILGGNNEDYSDPYTKIWFIPPEDGKYGWFKVGFNNGYPQGGMNEYGIFWDGVACAHLAMPEAEAGKIEYKGNLMQKVLEECTSLEDAITIFNNFYCQDLYNAQYLTGDAFGLSIIVEGDNLIHSQDSFHILTNFYQSHPDLGGYPCWRFETAQNMISKCEALDTYFAGTVLSATHQEGKYPTQYSNIYDPVNGLIYLFYFHNYEEYLVINLKKELDKGSKEYDIPKIFSQITIKDPQFGAVTQTTSPTLTWTGAEGHNYEIIYSTDPDLTQPVTVKVPSLPKQNISLAGAFIVAPILLLLLLGLRKKKYMLLPGLVLAFMLIVSSRCEKDDDDKLPPDTVEFSQKLSGLEPGGTYYWKVRASSDYSPEFVTETITYYFNTP